MQHHSVMYTDHELVMTLYEHDIIVFPSGRNILCLDYSMLQIKVGSISPSSLKIINITTIFVPCGAQPLPGGEGEGWALPNKINYYGSTVI